MVVERGVSANVPFIGSEILCKNRYCLETKTVAAGVVVLYGR